MCLFMHACKLCDAPLLVPRNICVERDNTSSGYSECPLRGRLNQRPERFVSVEFFDKELILSLSTDGGSGW